MIEGGQPKRPNPLVITVRILILGGHAKTCCTFAYSVEFHGTDLSMSVAQGAHLLTGVMQPGFTMVLAGDDHCSIRRVTERGNARQLGPVSSNEEQNGS